MIEIGGLYKDNSGLLLAYKNDSPTVKEFRMKPSYIFCVVNFNIICEGKKFARVVMTNTGKLQFLQQERLQLLLEKGYIEKIG